MVVQQANVKTLGDYIEGYTEAGIDILIPLEYGTKNKPLINWKPYQLRLPTADEKTAWFFSTGQLRNVAAVLGQTSRLVAIDIDGDAAKQRVERKLVEMGYCNNLRVSILDTMMTLTGSGGFHLLFRVNPWLFEDYDLRTKTLWYHANSDHCEIKFMGEGSIVILAPSLHPNGVNRYLWNGKAPIELSEETLKQLLEVFPEKYLPTTLDDHNATNSTMADNEVSSISAIRQSLLSNANSISSLSQKDIEELITALKPIYKVGKRNTITLGYAGILRKRGYTLKAVEDFCVVVCRMFSDEEIESRLHAVRGTFKKPIDKIAGWSWLNDIN